jgi:hypothetical protein
METPTSDSPAARTVTVDLVVAVLIFAAGALVVFDSLRIGAGWSSDGPQGGYFPFYIGALICVCAVAVGAQSVLKWRTERAVFVTIHQLRQVMVVLLPSLAYVLGVQWIGIYVSSLFFIALFMRFFGDYGWTRSAIVGIVVSGTSFVLFEIWFKIPLPKGPLERLLGY